MFIWCCVLFGLGVLAFLDTNFNFGEIFRRVNSVVFMLLSLGLLIRTRMLMSFQTKEKMMERITELESLTAKSDHTSVPARKEQEEVLY